jgi:hypothetical protein
MRITKRVIVIAFISFLGIFWFYGGGTKEGLEEKKPPDITADAAKGLASSFQKQMKAAGIPVPSAAETSAIFAQLTDLIAQEVSVTGRTQDAIREAEISTPVVNTVVPSFFSQSFFTGSKFGDAFCKTYTNKIDLNKKCGTLNSDTCNMTDCCIWINGNKCVGGSVNGPVQIDGVAVDAAYYSYKYNCYGGGCPP